MFKKSSFGSFSRFGKIFFAAVGTVGYGLYSSTTTTFPTHVQSHGESLLKDGFTTGLCRVAASGRVAWELFRGVSLALNPFRVSDAAASLQQTEEAHSAEVTFSGTIAAVLADLSTVTCNQEVLVHLGGSYLVGWLIKRATEDQGTLEQVKAEETIINLLGNEFCGQVVLSHPRVIPLLLLQAAHSSNSERLISALYKSLETMHPPKTVLQDDFKDTLTLLKGRHGSKIQHLAALLLATWCDASVLNCEKLANLECGKILVDVANSLTGRGKLVQQLQCDLARIMCVLARDCPSSSLLGVENWVGPLLYMLADATAMKDVDLTQCTVEAIGACVRNRPEEIGDGLKCSNLWPLLRKLARDNDARFRRLSAVAIADLASGGVDLPEDEYDYWVEQLISWILKEDDDDLLCGRCIVGLSGLSSTSNIQGLQLARHWLSELLILLSDPKIPTRHSPLPPPISPSYVRFVASEVRGLVSSASHYSDPPENTDSIRIQAEQALDWTETEGERGTPTSRALKVLCELVGNDWKSQEWLVAKGVVGLVGRLVDQEDHEDQDGCPISVQEEAARLLAMLSQHRVAKKPILGSGWVPWLEARMNSDNILLASNASRTLLHLERLQETEGNATEGSNSPVFRDGVHLFNPNAKHHWQLARKPTRGNGIQGCPLVDVVFVHGIRGGPFITWRTRDSDRELGNLVGSCWPSAWLAEDVPNARVLSLEYAAPVSGWEGESVPLRDAARSLLRKLTDAGVGHRPIIFISHSMGGIIVKEMLVNCMQQSSQTASQFLHNVQGLVFYTTPHHGTWLADLGLMLGRIGASPAPSVKFLKPGPYLMELNKAVQDWQALKGLPVLHYLEGEPTQLLPVVPKLVVVPPESAYPGYGEYVNLSKMDHVHACKPQSKGDVAYFRTLELVKQVVGSVCRDT